MAKLVSYCLRAGLLFVILCDGHGRIPLLLLFLCFCGNFLLFLIVSIALLVRFPVVHKHLSGELFVIFQLLFNTTKLCVGSLHVLSELFDIDLPIYAQVD